MAVVAALGLRSEAGLDPVRACEWPTLSQVNMRFEQVQGCWGSFGLRVHGTLLKFRDWEPADAIWGALVFFQLSNSFRGKDADDEYCLSSDVEALTGRHA